MCGRYGGAETNRRLLRPSMPDEKTKMMAVEGDAVKVRKPSLRPL
jgi:hypothetical protein